MSCAAMAAGSATVVAMAESPLGSPYAQRVDVMRLLGMRGEGGGGCLLVADGDAKVVVEEDHVALSRSAGGGVGGGVGVNKLIFHFLFHARAQGFDDAPALRDLRVYF
jgi:hypothetical protein